MQPFVHFYFVNKQRCTVEKVCCQIFSSSILQEVFRLRLQIFLLLFINLFSVQGEFIPPKTIKV